jgi:hypothetical protein
MFRHILFAFKEGSERLFTRASRFTALHHDLRKGGSELKMLVVCEVIEKRRIKDGIYQSLAGNQWFSSFLVRQYPRHGNGTILYSAGDSETGAATVMGEEHGDLVYDSIASTYPSADESVTHFSLLSGVISLSSPVQKKTFARTRGSLGGQVDRELLTSKATQKCILLRWIVVGVCVP